MFAQEAQVQGLLSVGLRAQVHVAGSYIFVSHLLIRSLSVRLRLRVAHPCLALTVPVLAPGAPPSAIPAMAHAQARVSRVRRHRIPSVSWVGALEDTLKFSGATTASNDNAYYQEQSDKHTDYSFYNDGVSRPLGFGFFLNLY